MFPPLCGCPRAAHRLATRLNDISKLPRTVRWHMSMSHDGLASCIGHTPASCPGDTDHDKWSEDGSM